MYFHRFAISTCTSILFVFSVISACHADLTEAQQKVTAVIPYLNNGKPVYTPFKKLPKALKKGYKKLKIKGENYKKPGCNAVESTYLFSLSKKQIKKGVRYLGYTETKKKGFDFSCYGNHYYSWAYEELDKKVREATIELGWTEEMWDADDPNNVPDTDDMEWADLTGAQQEAAKLLCYTVEIWNASGDEC